MSNAGHSITGTKVEISAESEPKEWLVLTQGGRENGKVSTITSPMLPLRINTEYNDGVKEAYVRAACTHAFVYDGDLRTLHVYEYMARTFSPGQQEMLGKDA